MDTYCRIGIIVVTLRSTFKETLFGAHKTRLWQFGATQRFKEIKSKKPHRFQLSFGTVFFKQSSAKADVKMTQQNGASCYTGHTEH